MTHILLLTDFSKNANNAIDYGIQLFGKENVKYTLMHAAYQTPSLNDAVLSKSDAGDLDIDQKLKHQVDLLKKIHESPHLNIKALKVNGKLTSIIKEKVKEIGPDYIVVGNRKRNDIDDFLLKGNTEEIIKKVNIPVITVPETVSYKALNNPILASTMEKFDYDHILKPLVDMLKRKDVSLKILNVHRAKELVTTNEAMAGTDLDNLLEGIPHTFCYNENTKVVEGISNFAKKEKSNLLVLIARKHKLFDRLFKGSVTKEIAKLAEFPMLVLHDK